MPEENTMPHHTFEIDEAQRQVTLLSLAVLALVRPGWDSMLGDVAGKLGGADARQLFVDFKRFNRDRYVASDRAAFAVKPYAFAACTRDGDQRLEFSMKALLREWPHAPADTSIILQFQDTEETSSFAGGMEISTAELSAGRPPEYIREKLLKAGADYGRWLPSGSDEKILFLLRNAFVHEDLLRWSKGDVTDQDLADRADEDRVWLSPEELEQWELQWRQAQELAAELAGDGLTAADLVDEPVRAAAMVPCPTCSPMTRGDMPDGTKCPSCKGKGLVPAEVQK